MSHFTGQPDGTWPYGQTNNARVMLLKAHETASGFLDSYRTSRHRKTGASTDAEQDLLRAMLAFATAGLDASLKQIVRECLPVLLDRAPAVGRGHNDVELGLQTFLARRSQTPTGPNYKLISEIVTSRQPRALAASKWIEELTAGSLQSRSAAIEVANALGLQGSQIFTSDLDRVFRARNEIVHEMDLKPGATKNRSRRQRSEAEMLELTQFTFTAAAEFLTAAEGMLNP